jgi:hypothetical protein
VASGEFLALWQWWPEVGPLLLLVASAETLLIVVARWWVHCQWQGMSPLWLLVARGACL